MFLKPWPSRSAQHLATFALALLAAWPVLTHGPAMAVDAPNHFYRLVELAWHVQHGDFYPRWFVDINYGLGGPLFNYYAPLSYYVPLLLHLVGLSLPTAFQAAFVLAVVVAAFGMAAWATAQFQSPLAGLLASAAYVLTPYWYYNLLIRGALPEVWGLAFAPWLLWATLTVINRPGRFAYFCLTLFYAALILAHSLSAVLFTLVLIIYIISVLGWPSRVNWKPYISIAGALALAVGLSAFFLLPFFLENTYINLSRANLDYTAAFVGSTDLFAWPIPFDPNLARNPYPISLSAATLLVAVIGLFVYLWQKHRNPGATATAFWVSLLVFSAGSLSLTLPLWQALPLGKLIQFPWRLLAPATLLLAWLAGLAVTSLNRRWPWALALAGIFFYSLTWTYIYSSTSQYLLTGSPADIVEYETAHPVALGLTYQQEFLPIWVQQPPTPQEGRSLYSLRGNSPDRLINLPQAVHILAGTSSLTSFDYTYQSDQTATLDFYLAYFPGWVATVDDLPIEPIPTQPQGHLSLQVPAGQHHLHLELRSTLVQLTANLMSLASLIVLVVFCLRAYPASQPEAPALPGLSWAWAVLFGALLVLRFGVLDRTETPFFHTQINQLPNPPSASVHFGDQLALIGLDLSQAQVQPADRALTIRLYWQALSDLQQDYHVSIQLVDDQGNRFGQSDQYPGYVPTGGWSLGQYLPDEHTWTALDGTPPGTYHLRVSVYSLQSLVAIPLPVAIAGTDSGTDYDLGTLTLTPGWLGQAGPLQIVEAASAAQTLTVGDALPFSLAWQTGPLPVAGIRAQLNLIDQSGIVVYSTQFDPTDHSFPSDQWLPNQLIRYPHSLVLPANLPGGPVHASILFQDAAGQSISAPVALLPLTIIVPARTFTVPQVSHPLDYVFGGLIRLLGYNASSTALVLYWQAEQNVANRYTIFIHNLDSSGALLSGQDSPPERATTSWLPGEVITDSREPLTSPYFEVGLYDSITGERLGEPLKLGP